MEVVHRKKVADKSKKMEFYNFSQNYIPFQTASYRWLPWKKWWKNVQKQLNIQV